MRRTLLPLRAFVVCGIAVTLFLAGYGFAARQVTSAAAAEDGRLFELRIYHSLPGKLPVMEARFREKTSKILARHGLNVIGYWASTGPSASQSTFVFLLAHEDRDEAKKHWNDVISDPEFKAVEKSEQSEKTLERAEVLYLRPTDFSAMK